MQVTNQNMANQEKKSLAADSKKTNNIFSFIELGVKNHFKTTISSIKPKKIKKSPGCIVNISHSQSAKDETLDSFHKSPSEIEKTGFHSGSCSVYSPHSVNGNFFCQHDLIKDKNSDIDKEQCIFNDDLGVHYYPHTEIQQPKSSYATKLKIYSSENNVNEQAFNFGKQPLECQSNQNAPFYKNNQPDCNSKQYNYPTSTTSLPLTLFENQKTTNIIKIKTRAEQKTNKKEIYSSNPSFSINFPKSNSGNFIPIDGSFLPLDNDDIYPMWNKNAPVSISDISKIFKELGVIFLFQDDNLSNIFDYFLKMLDSRASRMSPNKALKSLYLDYIGGKHANFRKWYFASKCDLDDFSESKYSKPLSLHQLENLWIQNYKFLTVTDYITQLALFLLIWGEAGQIRYMPECLCFIYKCCIDRYYYLKNNNIVEINSCLPFLDQAITPLYNYCRDQLYSSLDENTFVSKDKDHVDIVGYDDVNQFFWFRDNLLKIPLEQNKKRWLHSYSNHEKYLYLNSCNWNKTFQKTYKEYRTWYHILTNFNRVWIIHVCIFWYYTVFNAKPLFTPSYKETINNQPSTEWTLSIMSLAGSIAAIINLLALIGESFFCPKDFSGTTPLFKKVFLTLALLFVVSTPTAYIVFVDSSLKVSFFSKSAFYFTHGWIALFVYIFQFLMSIVMVAYYAFTPLNNLYHFDFKKTGRDYLANTFFTDSVIPLKGTSKLTSNFLWLSIFFFKFLETYFFLALPLKDTLRELMILKYNRTVGDSLIGGKVLFKYQSIGLLVLVVTIDFILFFLDTYLWYIIATTTFSVFRSFYIGVSIWTPWKNIFSRLPSRIFMKIIHSDLTHPHLKKNLVSIVWNSIIISLYREHLISFEHVQKLIYTCIENNTNLILKEPDFFVNQEDMFNQTYLFKSEPEAQRRINFFAQSLSIPISSSYPINEMPSFTVMIPHFKEKIMLSLKEIIKNGDDICQVTLLEYLKNLHESEWKYFIQDTNQLIAKNNFSSGTTFDNNYSEVIKCHSKTVFEEKNADNALSAPLASVGFKTATPEYILRTRIWASLRSQTLYRTISGFMNYSKAIKILYDVEEQILSEKIKTNKHISEIRKELPGKSTKEASIMAFRKYRLLVSMQRMTSFETEEEENKEFLLRAYPELQIAYIEDVINKETKIVEYFSCLIDGNCMLLDNGNRKPKYRIKLSGNPILGDGKADNQNHCLIFSRGECLQLIDANQDNYLEECLKIRNVLAEFEFKTAVGDKIPEKSYHCNESKNNSNEVDKTRIFNQKLLERYGRSTASSSTTINTSKSFDSVWESQEPPVAIIGTREYIFSENIGILGDVSAAKEQIFGTLSARTLAKIGAKLHYGHPDFLNTVFMTTRGGVSKGQKGLHLNEDIYSGMNTLLRGGRIKHCEYIQCGKGRDLGFGSILNFTTKIGAGMGEQFLSREYFYLGTQLPLDRFLSFFYAHPGFHLNNTLIIASIKLFLLIILNLSFMISNSIICVYDKHVPFTDPKKPPFCANLIPVMNWLKRSVFSICSVFLVAFIPLFFQELLEKGSWKAFSRVSKHFMSLSPLFEVFVCKVYSTALISDLTIGDARYISTGRGFATTRSSFSRLYSRFAPEAFYYSSITSLLLLSASFSTWDFSYLYFWTTIIALMMSPFLFNPNQFLWSEFFLDYKKYLRWLSAGNTIYRKNSLHNNKSYIKTKNEGSWISYIKELRTRAIGSKRQSKKKNEFGKFSGGLFCKSPSIVNIFLNKILPKSFFVLFIGSIYTFSNSQDFSSSPYSNNTILRILLVSLCPMVINSGILIVLGFLSLATGPILSVIFTRYPSFIAVTGHILAIINHIFFIHLLFAFQRWNVGISLLGVALSISLQNLIITIVISFILTKELTTTDRSNKAWWSGRWFSSELGKRAVTQPFREFLCKWIEMSWFTADFFIGHILLFIQIPLLFIPQIDRLHMFLLFWLKPNEQIFGKLLSIKRKGNQNYKLHVYTLLFFFIVLLCFTITIGPIIFLKTRDIKPETVIPDSLKFLIHSVPDDVLNSKKGLKEYKKLMLKYYDKKLENDY